MFPIRDDAPRSGTPFITWFLILLNVAVFLFQISLGRADQSVFLYQFGVVPARVGVVLYAPQEATAAGLVPVFTSMFLHGGWLHLIANMWALWIFGDNIEGYLGRFKYLLLYFAAGVVGSLVHIAFNFESQVPAVGASGAIAGVMGAYFLLFPSSRVLTLVPLIVIFTFIWLPAWLVLGFWFVAQFISGAADAFTTTPQAGGVAFWAHVGGFLAGFSLVKLFPGKPKPYRYNWQ